jgi:hypothetical protein
VSTKGQRHRSKKVIFWRTIINGPREKHTMTKSNSRIEIKESVSNSLTIIGALIFLLGYGWYNQAKYIGDLGEPVLFSIMILILCVLLFKVYTLLKRKTLMAIDSQGVYHKAFNQKSWDDILSIKKTRKDSGDSELVFFIFQTTSGAYEINISNMDVSENELIKLIRRHKDYNIYEVPYNEWD